ncbi:MAG: polysaccharide biosynthesis/export family protein [Vicinamibacterales bacterium]
MTKVLRRLVPTAIALAAVLAAAGATAAQAAYQIGQGDILKVAVWSQPELSGEFTVDVAGAITLPLIGGVKAAGQTIEQVEKEIRDRLADGYVVNPQVAIGVAQFKSQRVFVVGEVRTPGVVPLSGALTLLEALTRVGSFTEFAGGELVVVRPAPGRAVTGPVLAGDPGASEVLRLDVQQLQAKGPTSNIDLLDGDTIVVPRAEVIYVNGQVNSPGSYAYERDMTILMAISKANGINDLGSNRRVKIIRIVNGKRTELKAALGDKVLPGDTVTVGNRWF